MKKILAIAALVAVALTSCVKNETFAPAEEISFENFTLSSKALVNAGVFDTNLTFGVFATDNGTDFTFVDNDEVVYKTSYTYWGFDPAKYWPTNAGAPVDVDFYAYYPYNDNTGTEQVTCDLEDGISITDANLGTTIGSQKDYLVAPVVVDKNVTNAAAGVDVVFKHIASLILFSAEDVTEIPDLQELVTINSITIKQVSTSGNYVNTAANTVAGTWTPDAADDLAAIPVGKLVTTAGLDLTSTTEKPVLVVPTTLTADTEQVVINYTIADYVYGGYPFTGKTENATFDLKAGAITEWEQGKKYVYNLKFKLTEELEIKFNPTVTDWTDGGADLEVDVAL